MTKTRTIALKGRREADFDGVGFRKGWRLAIVDDGKSAEEYDQNWAWLAPTKDTLILVRPAIMSASIWVIGAWRADTLFARAELGSDAGMMGAAGTRANAFGIRFECDSKPGAARALAALVIFQNADVPNPALGIVEDSIDQATMKAHREKAQ